MLSTVDLERLIAVKRREIEKEKTRLGLAPSRSDCQKASSEPTREKNETSNTRPVSEGTGQHDALEEGEVEDIPPDLERYIRRYLGLPVMLKAGEYSPNNPLVRCERPSGDALLGLGEYERRRNTLRRIRQQQYKEYLDQSWYKVGEYSPNNPLVRGERPSGDALLGLGEYERRRNTLRRIRQQQYKEYLDQQAKKKQEEKEQAEREKKEREQKEKEREEKERERQRLERERGSPDRTRTYAHTVFNPTQSFTSKVDTGVQTTGLVRPLSVAVQTDDVELYRPSPSPRCPLTQAERELSPRTVLDSNPRPAPRRACDLQQEPASLNRRQSASERPYRPSIFDADAIQLRNAQAEKEAAAKRQFYQQELKNQIQEQQRIREQRKAREKMLEQAEMRRLEEQLRMLRVAQEREIGKQIEVDEKMRENATDYEKKRTALQKEIENEQKTLQRFPKHRSTFTSHSDTPPSRLPLYFPPKPKPKPYSTNIPDNSVFSPSYDVDSHLRRNLNPSKELLFHSRLPTSNSELNLSSKYLNTKLDRETGYDIKSNNNTDCKETGYSYNDKKQDDFFSSDRRVVVEKALVHERPKEKKYEPSNREIDNPIPVLRHSPVVTKSVLENDDLSDAMKVVDDKWKVPVVQKNILKSLPNEDGKNVNILTQLGSIRRQLQLEQLKLDKMLTKDDI